MRKNILKEIKKQELHSYYFITNEKQFYEEHHYYKVIPRILGKTLDNILLNPFGEIVVQRVGKILSKEEAEKIAALSHYLSVERTEYKNTMFLKKKPSQQMKFSFLIWILC